MVDKKIIKNITKMIDTLRKRKIKVNKVVLYGSRATDTYHKDSDIDIAIISSDFGKDRYEEGIMLFELASQIDPRIEPIPITLQSYNHDTWIPLIYEIRTKGIELIKMSKIHTL